MVIREATETDLEQVIVLFQQLHPREPMLPVAELRSTWHAIFANPIMHCIVAEIAGKLVSTCTLTVIPNLTRHARPYGLIENVVTHADHRRKGLATAVLKAAQEIAWKHGCYKVHLMTGSRKEETLRFYEQAGFVRGEKTAFVARRK